MIAWTIYLTLAGAVLLLLLPCRFARWIALLTTIAGLALGLIALVRAPISDVAHFTTIVRVPWVPLLGMNYHLAIDGVSLTMVLVTGISAVSTALFSWDVDHRQREFFFWLLLVVGGCYGVFLSADLFLFFAFYELVIVPKYFLIAIFGSTNKEYGAMKLTLLVLRWNARFRRNPCRLRDSRLPGSESTGAIPLQSSVAIMGLSCDVPRLRCACRHLAIAYLGSDRPRGGAHRRVDVACRHRDETGFLCGTARRHECLSRRIPDLEQLDRHSGRNRNCLRGGGRSAPT